ncbi:MAG TPA: cupin domain-containing protein [Rubricoccaceae bacterium]|jgi:mannose-6-phosphate isomerase-like protein (cupin superfamily)
MIIRRAETKTFPIPNCHGGTGAVVCREVLADYDRATAGFTLVHDDTLAPGVSVGEHRHVGDEEVYVILEGEGEMVVDGVVYAVGPGDVCVTRDGETHGITNTGAGALRVLVVGAALGSAARTVL